jgi:hypothetical protein
MLGPVHTTRKRGLVDRGRAFETAGWECGRVRCDIAMLEIWLDARFAHRAAPRHGGVMLERDREQGCAASRRAASRDCPMRGQARAPRLTPNFGAEFASAPVPSLANLPMCQHHSVQYTLPRWLGILSAPNPLLSIHLIYLR